MNVKMRYLGLILLVQIFPIEVFGSIDPNLVGWWKFDENQGIVVIDDSGRAQHGTFHGGNPLWQPGRLGGSLWFDGIDDYVELPIGPLVASLTQATLSFWINIPPPPDFQNLPRPVFTFIRNSFTQYLYFTPPHEAPGELLITNNGFSNAQTVLLPPGVPEGWTHFAVTLDGTTAQVFYNGQLFRSNKVSLTPQSLGETTSNWLGKPRPGVPDDRFFTGLLDDFRIYKTALSTLQIREIMRGGMLQAFAPEPSDGKLIEKEPHLEMSWEPGSDAITHDLYLGTDENTVSSAEVTDPLGVYRGRYDTNQYVATDLVWGHQYYWRIDEIQADGTIHRGQIWSFIIAGRITIDNFDDYTDNTDTFEAIHQTWIDGDGYFTYPVYHEGNGTGSTTGYAQAPYAEQRIVHSGSQSMPLGYDNSQFPFYSEVQRDFEIPQDWTREGVAALVLYFYGSGSNVPDQLYLRMEDAEGKTATVSYSEHPITIKEATWHEWNVDLTAINQINVKAVSRLVIGISNPTNTPSSGQGTVFIDDIALYMPRRVHGLVHRADINQDFIVDYNDMELLLLNWQVSSGDPIIPSDPGTDNLVGHWPLDGSLEDTSANGHHGKILGRSLDWTEGWDDRSLYFSGTDTEVELPIGSIFSSGNSRNYTFSMWIYMLPQNIQPLLTLTQGDINIKLFFSGGDMFFGNYWNSLDADLYITRRNFSFDIAKQWRHIAVVMNEDEQSISIFSDGTHLEKYKDSTIQPMFDQVSQTTQGYLGWKRDYRETIYYIDRYYKGLLDDFRIYNRALSIEEVGYLAGKRNSYVQELRLLWTEIDPEGIDPDINLDGIVDIKDVFELLDHWLEVQIWP